MDKQENCPFAMIVRLWPRECLLYVNQNGKEQQKEGEGRGGKGKEKEMGRLGSSVG